MAHTKGTYKKPGRPSAAAKKSGHGLKASAKGSKK